MTTLSDPTLGHLVQVAASEFSRDELGTLLLRADLEKQRYLISGSTSGGSSKHSLVRLRLTGARRLAREGDAEAHHSLLTFVRMLVEQTVHDPEDPPSWFAGLCESLLGDGFHLAWDLQEETPNHWGLPPVNVTVTYRIFPTDSGPVPLAEEITALERDLDLRGYAGALSHYRQAVNNLSQHQYEASNGQLRTMLEALVVRIARDNAGYVGRGQAGEGGAAINHIVTTSALPEREGGKMLQGLWNMTHTNGPHPGQSTADEARMRMQLITATARFLLSHFPA